MKTVLFILSFLGAAASALACSCAGPRTFCETISDENGAFSTRNRIVAGRVTQTGEDGVRMEAGQVFFGELEAETFFIKNGNGAVCTVSTQNWQAGDEFLLAVDTDADLSGFYLSICAVQYLPIENGRLVGLVAPGVEALPLSEFGSLAGCVNPYLLFNLPARLYPNPTLAGLKLELLAPQPLFGDAEIYDVAGRSLWRRSDAVVSDLEIELPDWPAGIYVLVVRTPIDRRAFRFVLAKD